MIRGSALRRHSAVVHLRASGHCLKWGPTSVSDVLALLGRVKSLAGLVGVAVPAAVAAHCGGYELFHWLETWLGPLSSDPHAHHSGSSVHANHFPLIPLSTGALLVGASVVLAVVLAGRRLGGLPSLNLRLLVIAQLIVVVLIEVGAGAAGAGWQPAWLVAGLALQVPVALLVFSLVRHVRHAIARLLSHPHRLSAAGTLPALGLRCVDLPPRSTWASPATVRGPPVRVGTPTQLHTRVAGS